MEINTDFHTERKNIYKESVSVSSFVTIHNAADIESKEPKPINPKSFVEFTAIQTKPVPTIQEITVADKQAYKIEFSGGIKNPDLTLILIALFGKNDKSVVVIEGKLKEDQKEIFNKIVRSLKFTN